MSLAVLKSRALNGIEAPEVSVEVHLANGLPAFHVVGLAETEVKEARDRVRAAIVNAGFEMPHHRITVNLAPADLPKESGRFDLAIALGILAASGQIPAPPLARYEFAGELSLTGELRPIRGALAMTFAMQRARARRAFILPRANADEAALVEGAAVYPAATLLEVCNHFRAADGTAMLARHQPAALPPITDHPDFAEVKGQWHAKRALEVAAAGGHSILFVGYNAPMPTAYSYARFSSAEQAKGRSKNRQQDPCAAYCEKHGLTLATGKDYTFLDAGKSAFKGEHLDPVTGDLARFFRLVENGSILPGSYLLVESLDRLGRDRVMDALERFNHLLKSGINIVTLTDGKCYTNDKFELPELMLSILVMSRAHEESSTKAVRVADAYRKKHSEARESHKPMGNVAPMWLELVDGEYVEVAEQAAAVRRIFKLCIDGYGKAVIAKMLNEERIPSPKGLRWGSSSVDKVLNNRAVFGEYQPYTSHGLTKRQPHGNPIEGYFPSVVDRDTFYLAQEAIKGRRIAKSTKQSKNFNVWSGVAKCGLCRSPLHLVNKGLPPKGRKYLRCSLAAKGGCNAKIIRLDQSEFVFRHILARIDSVALVQDNAQKIERDLRLCDAKLSEQDSLLTQYREGLKRKYSETLADLAHDAEQVVKSLRAEKRTLEQALADQRIVNRRDFVKLVDLDTYEGRNKANSLLKRLGIAVFIGQGYYITQNNVGFLAIAYHEGKVAAMDLDNMEGYDGLGEEPAVQLLDLMKKKAPFAEGW